MSTISLEVLHPARAKVPDDGVHCAHGHEHDETMCRCAKPVRRFRLRRMPAEFCVAFKRVMEFSCTKELFDAFVAECENCFHDAEQAWVDVKAWIFLKAYGGGDVFFPPPRIRIFWKLFSSHASYRSFCMECFQSVVAYTEDKGPRVAPRGKNKRYTYTLVNSVAWARKTLGPLSSNWNTRVAPV